MENIQNVWSKSAFTPFIYPIDFQVPTERSLAKRENIHKKAQAFMTRNMDFF